MDTPNARTPRFSGSQKTLAAVAAVFVALILAYAISRHKLEADPVVSIPTRALPSPNAFDDYARATSLMKDTKIVDSQVQTPRGVIGATMPPPQMQERILRDNAPAFAALRQGIGHSYASPPMRSFSAAATYLAPDRGMARLLAFRANVEAERGDWAASAATCLDGLKLGSDVPRGGGLIHSLVGVAIDAISRKPLRSALDHLSLPETQNALKRLQAIDRNPQTTAQTLQEEKWSTDAGLMEIFHQPNWRKALFVADGSDPDNAPSPPLRADMYFVSKQRVMDDYNRYMDTAIADAKAGRATPLPLPAQSDPFTEVVAPVFSGAAMKFHEDRTQNAFLEIQLALRAYDLTHHAYPASLAALTPNLLPSIPIDSFAPTRPMQYRKTATSYLLYSVGPDGADDGGKAIDDLSKSDVKRRRFVQNDSKGDIVAGVNF